MALKYNTAINILKSNGSIQDKKGKKITQIYVCKAFGSKSIPSVLINVF